MPNYSGLFRVDESFTLSLITAFLDDNGVEALEWEPGTIRLEIREDYGVDPSQVIMDKIQAGISLLTTDMAYVYWEPFEEIVHVLNDYEADFESMRPPRPEELSWGVLESHLIEPPEGQKLSDLYSAEIKAYVATILKKNGFHTSPELLQFVDMSEWCCDPSEEFPALRDDIADVQKVKALRVRAYIAERYGKLQQELKQYFSRDLPELSLLLSREFAW